MDRTGGPGSLPPRHHSRCPRPPGLGDTRRSSSGNAFVGWVISRSPIAGSVRPTSLHDHNRVQLRRCLIETAHASTRLHSHGSRRGVVRVTRRQPDAARPDNASRREAHRVAPKDTSSRISIISSRVSGPCWSAWALSRACSTVRAPGIGIRWDDRARSQHRAPWARVRPLPVRTCGSRPIASCSGPPGDRCRSSSATPVIGIGSRRCR